MRRVRLCPVCGYPVRSNKTTRDKFGAKHTYITCPNCGTTKHVYINDDGSVGRDFVKYNHKYSKEDLDYQDACKKEAEAFKNRVYPKIKIKQKPQPKTGVIIHLDPTKDYSTNLEELQKRLDTILGNV